MGAPALAVHDREHDRCGNQEQRGPPQGRARPRVGDAFGRAAQDGDGRRLRLVPVSHGGDGRCG